MKKSEVSGIILLCLVSTILQLPFAEGYTFGETSSTSQTPPKKQESWQQQPFKWQQQNSTWPKQPSTWQQQPFKWQQQNSTWQKQPSTWQKQPSTWQQQPSTWKPQSSTWKPQSSTWKPQSSTWKQQSSTWQQQPSSWQKRPSTWQQTAITTKCSLEDSQCLTKQAQAYLPTFVKGNPQLGIPSLEKLDVNPGTATFDNFYYNVSDMKVVGLKDAVIDKVSVNTDLKYLRILFHTDIKTEFFYTLEGVLLSVLPVSGSGRGELNLKNLEMDLLFLFEIKKDATGQDFMHLTSYQFGHNSADISIQLQDLYNGDKEKSEKYHKFAKELWRILIFNYGTTFQSSIAGKIFETIKIFMSSKPLQELALYENQ